MDQVPVSSPLSSVLTANVSAPSPAPLNVIQDVTTADTPNTDSSNINVNPLSASRSTSVAPLAGNGTPPPPSFGMPQLSASTEEILQRVAAARNAGFNPGTPGYEAAKQQVLKTMRTSDSIQVASAATPPPVTTIARGGRGGRGSRGGRGRGGAVKVENGSTPTAMTPGSGRGRGVGRPRGRGRGGRRKSGKRKRGSDEEDEDDDDNDSEDSNEYTPVATTTKSGRNVNKPTTYVPTIPSPPAVSSTVKRRKTGGRHPSAASKCKTCQRGHSPQGNQIVFCDNCNAGYHQYCHHPPIEKDVVMVLDKEWICGNCVRERDGLPVDDVPKAGGAEKYWSGERWTGDEKRRYFESLPSKVAADLLLRATVLYPTIPIFPSIPGLYDPSDTNGEQNGAHDDDADASPPPEYFDDDPPAHYPKPGFGLARTLPPESEHMQYLVDENTEVFSHFFPAEEAATSGGVEAVVGIGGIAVG